jgi:hypothetical protein
MKVDYSLYQGWKLAGAIRAVIASRTPVVENGLSVGTLGSGRFLARTASGQQ